VRSAASRVSSGADTAAFAADPALFIRNTIILTVLRSAAGRRTAVPLVDRELLGGVDGDQRKCTMKQRTLLAFAFAAASPRR
jgi:hypothetical protein